MFGRNFTVNQNYIYFDYLIIWKYVYHIWQISRPSFFWESDLIVIYRFDIYVMQLNKYFRTAFLISDFTKHHTNFYHIFHYSSIFVYLIHLSCWRDTVLYIFYHASFFTLIFYLWFIDKSIHHIIFFSTHDTRFFSRYHCNLNIAIFYNISWQVRLCSNTYNNM